MPRQKSIPGCDPGYHPASLTGPLLLASLLGYAAPGVLVALAAVCLALAFVFALFENSLQHYSRVRLMDGARRRGTEAEIDRILLEEEALFFASKVGRGLGQIIAVVLLAAAVSEISLSPLAVAGWAVGFCAFYLLLNLAAPYVLADRYADGILLRGLLPYASFLLPFRPLAALLHKAASRLVRKRKEPDPAEEIADEILSAVEEGAREGTLEHTEKRMIEGVIDLRDVTADHIMTPRTEMVCLPVEATVSDAAAKAQERGLSRLPVYRGTQDDIVGILYVKDLLPYLGKTETPPIEGLLRRPFFIPQSKLVGELLQEMRARQVHLAVVLDEYGGTAGVVTIEDILEEIVGEIADEHEGAAPSEVVKLGANAASVEGRTHIDDLNRALDLCVPESEEYETVGGLLFTRLGRVPSSGEQFDLEGVHFTVVDADERRVHRVKVSVDRTSEAERA